jgi:tetratricopeptide (TPR) repeat protein
LRASLLISTAVLGGCVYFNAMYDANRQYDAALGSLRKQSDVQARVEFDSVIAKTGRIIEGHPGSKYADDAAILKTRAELHRRMWESAVETSVRAEELAGSPKIRAVALGLRGTARRELGQVRAADSLLSLGLAGKVDADDEALFLFQRGLAREQLGRSDDAAVDLEAAANSVNLSPEGSLTLSVALREIGQYRRSAEVAARLLATASPNTESPLYLHVDSLSVLAPAVVDSMAGALASSAGAIGPRLAAYRLIAGRARFHQGRVADALASFDEAMGEAPNSQAGADAAFYAIELRLQVADRPEDVTALLGSFALARRAGTREMRSRNQRWEQASLEFEGLMGAYASRGESAAEAVLRAAEVANVDLEALRLARGCYLRYLELVPASRWAAKAIYGALSVTGHPPDPEWVADDGEATDRELRSRLADLPADDPYRLALDGTGGGDFMADSMYVLAEADLRRRLIEIRTLFNPTAADTARNPEANPVQPPDDEVQPR